MKYAIIILLLIPGILLHAQVEQNEEADLDIVNILRLDILAPGIGGEVALGNKGSVEGSFNMGFAAGVIVTNDDRNGYFLVSPAAHIQFRGYFNRAKRLERGKSIYNNSGLFAGLHIGYNAPDIFSTDEDLEIGHTLVAGPVFGVQKTFDRNVQIGFSFGIGIRVDENSGAAVGGPGNFHISYVFLPKRQKKVIKLD